MRRLVTKNEFALLAGVKPPSIQTALKGKLKPALVVDRIDANHPAAIEYLAKHGAVPPPPLAPIEDDDHVPVQQDVKAFESLTLREIVEKYGTARKFRDHLDALKKIEDIRKTRLDNDEKESTLIERELVKVHVLGLIDSVHKRLLVDLPKTATLRIYAEAISDRPREGAEKILRELIRDQLRPLKAKVVRTLRKKSLQEQLQ